MKIITRTFCCILVLLLMLGSNVFAVSTPTMKGIDVSRHQGVINWDAVYGNTDFAIIRCGFGNDETSQDDTQWYNNANECTRLGIPFGVYIYSYATNTSMAESEANHVLRLVNGYNLSFPIYLDMEDNVQVVLSPGELGNIASTFCNIIQNAGYEVGIYANRNWWENHLTDAVFNNNLWHKWVAQYNSQCTYAGNYTMWQYTSSGNVNGINGRVDMNYWYGDLRGVSGDNNSVIVNTTIADTITSSNAVVRGTVSYSGNRPIEAGIYFGTSPDNMSKVARYTIEHNKNPFYIEDEPYYHIDIAVVTGGTIKLTAPDSVKANSTVTFTVEPSNGYHVVADSVKVNNGDIAVSENEGVYSFIMPAETATITAEFEEDIPIIQKYTVIITGDEGIENVKLGTMNGKKADNTYTFTDIVAGTYTFDVIYAAGYEKSDLSPESITVSENKTTETISSQKKKFTVIFKIEGQDDIKVSNIEYNTAPTGAPSLTDTATRHYLGWVKGTDTAANVINLADERITEDTVYTAKYETLTPQPEKIWLELLPKFKEWLQIEKITVENEVTLSASKKDDSEFDEADKFSVYVAVYDDDILQSVKKVYWAEEENNTFKASISEPDGENYKVFIWTSNYEPITEAITSLTTEKQTVLNK